MTVTDVYSFVAGDSPLLLSVPHDGRDIPAQQRARMTPAGLDIPDTDWHVAALYDFAHAAGASVIVAHYSRYVVDLNRPASDEALYPGQVATGLCPQRTFAGDAIYQEGDCVSAAEQAERTQRYWQPYHEQIGNTLRALRERHGHALLWDAHSIPSVVPRLFDGELPELNLGSNDGRSCPPAVTRAVAAVAGSGPYASVTDGRFKGGYITRHYGQPQKGIVALQLEIAQRAYMEEATRQYDDARARRLRLMLGDMLAAYRDTAARCF